jgi:hypothetical protein
MAEIAVVSCRRCGDVIPSTPLKIAVGGAPHCPLCGRASRWRRSDPVVMDEVRIAERLQGIAGSSLLLGVRFFQAVAPCATPDAFFAKASGRWFRVTNEPVDRETVKAIEARLAEGRDGQDGWPV